VISGALNKPPPTKASVFIGSAGTRSWLNFELCRRSPSISERSGAAQIDYLGEDSQKTVSVTTVQVHSVESALGLGVDLAAVLLSGCEGRGVLCAASGRELISREAGQSPAMSGIVWGSSCLGCDGYH
jgi:hypothetical protein